MGLSIVKVPGYGWKERNRAIILYTAASHRDGVDIEALAGRIRIKSKHLIRVSVEMVIIHTLQMLRCRVENDSHFIGGHIVYHGDGDRPRIAIIVSGVRSKSIPVVRPFFVKCSQSP